MNRRAWLTGLILVGFFCASCTLRQSLPLGQGTAMEKDTAIEKGAAVAVWDFDNLSPSAEGQPPSLGELLSAQVMESLQSRGDVTVIERQRLHLALEELKLGSTSLADEATRLKLGHLVGARLMVFGAYQAIAGTMRLDLRLVEVETGKVRNAVKGTASSGDMAEWLKTAREAAAGLL
ncbi:MAG: CsgG/HfaB family protein [bacterium]